MSCVIRKPNFCICETKGTDQLCGNCAADQRLCFCYIDRTIPLLHYFKPLAISTIAQPSLCQRKLQRQVFSRPSSFMGSIKYNNAGNVFFVISDLLLHVTFRSSHEFCFNFLEKENNQNKMLEVKQESNLHETNHRWYYLMIGKCQIMRLSPLRYLNVLVLVEGRRPFCAFITGKCLS